MDKWYIKKGPESDVVVSSRVRLARNFKEYPFPIKLNDRQSSEVVDKVKNAVLNTDKSENNFLFINIHELDEITKQMLVEKHLLSPEFIQTRIRNGALISKDEKVSIMVNEEDHLRIQCLFAGMQIEEAWKLCDEIDSRIEQKINYAYDENFGYLTSCPTNVGTALRASVMLHLPALTMTGYIKNILEACSKLGVAVRGIYGEHSEASGNMFQISNQVSLGQTEKEIITGMNNMVSQIIEQERVIRKQLYAKNTYGFEDKIYRSLGILKNARVISTEESAKLLSNVRLGVNMGIIKDINLETINEIMLATQPANLQKAAGERLNSDARDIKRAEIIRNKLNY